MSKVFVESLESRTMLSAAIMPLVAGTHPHIVVQGHGLVIAAGDATPSLQDFTNFGATSTSLGALTRRFVIRNTGTAPLSISTLSIAGLAPGDFTITAQPTGDIAPGGRAPVIISFSPLGFGTRSARVVIRSNDPSIPSDRFAIQGTGLAPAIVVQGQPIVQVPAVKATKTTPAVPAYLTPAKAVTIASGDMIPSGQDSTDFGPMSTTSGASTRRYVIRNKGAAPLSISSVSIVGLNAGDFILTQVPTGDIAPGGKGVVIVSFSPAATGTRTAKLVIRSNDPAIPLDKFAITGQGLATTNLPDGLQWARTAAGAGPKAAYNTVIKVHYSGFLSNGVMFDSSAGTEPITIAIADFTDPAIAPQVIDGWNEGLKGMRPGEHRTLIIPPSLAYGSVAKGNIPPNSRLIFETELVSIVGPFPYLTVFSGAGTFIPSGTATASASLGTTFGRTTVGKTVSRTFLLKTTDMKNSGLDLHTMAFAKTTDPFSWSRSSYDSTRGGWPITITYHAMAVGTADTTVTIYSGDLLHPAYRFAIHARAVA